MTAHIFPHVRWWKELSLALAIALVLGLALALVVNFEVAGQDSGQNAGENSSQNALQPSALAWAVACIDCPHYFADLTKQAAQIDNQGVIHVVYGGDALYHAWSTPTGWQVEVADAQRSVGRYAALAIDSGDRLHAVYFDDQARGLRYAVREAGQWRSEAIQATGVLTANPYPTIGAGPDGYPQIAYYQAMDGDLHYLVRGRLGWNDELVDNQGDVGRYASLAVDSNNNPHITYYDATKNALRYAVRAGGPWTTRLVAEFGGQEALLALDKNGRAHIVVYHDPIHIYSGPVYYVESEPGWQMDYLYSIMCEDHRECSWPSGLRLDTAGNPVVAYYMHFLSQGQNMTKAFVTKRTGDAWQVGEDVGADNEHPLLVLAQDSPHIVGVGAPQLVEHVKTQTGWQARTIDRTGQVGRKSSLAIDARNRGHVSALDFGGGTYVYGLRSASTWVTTPFSPTSDVRPETVLSVDGAGWPHILYWDPLLYLYSLDYIVQDANGWSLVSTFPLHPFAAFDMAIDPAGAGYFVAGPKIDYWQLPAGGSQPAGGIESEAIASSSVIAVDRQHVPHIAYIASPMGEDTRLMYASVRGGHWFTETLATGLLVTSTVSIAVGPGGQPFIAYDDGAIKLTKRTDGGWQTITVASSSQPGSSEADLAVDNQAQTHLAYYDAAPGDLMYALVLPAAWADPPIPPQTMVVDSAGDVGQGPSIALDSCGVPHISYYDASRRDLKEGYLLPPATNFCYLPAIGKAR